MNKLHIVNKSHKKPCSLSKFDLWDLSRKKIQFLINIFSNAFLLQKPKNQYKEIDNDVFTGVVTSVFENCPSAQWILLTMNYHETVIIVMNEFPIDHLQMKKNPKGYLILCQRITTRNETEWYVNELPKTNAMETQPQQQMKRNEMKWKAYNII